LESVFGSLQIINDVEQEAEERSLQVVLGIVVLLQYEQESVENAVKEFIAVEFHNSTEENGDQLGNRIDIGVIELNDFQERVLLARLQGSLNSGLNHDDEEFL
jgi:hypothetical protein